MFDFEKLDVYQKAKKFNKLVAIFLSSSKVDKTTKDQLRRSSFSIMLNIAEGSGRFTNPHKTVSRKNRELERLNLILIVVN